jgi:hypothetical protein
MMTRCLQSSVALVVLGTIGALDLQQPLLESSLCASRPR